MLHRSQYGSQGKSLSLYQKAATRRITPLFTGLFTTLSTSLLFVWTDTTHIERYSSGVIMDLTGEDEWSDWEDEETPAQSLLEDRMLPSAKARWSFG